MISICDTICACAAFAGIKVANSCISRATRASRQVDGVSTGGGEASR
jgi:hypothetical protein